MDLKLTTTGDLDLSTGDAQLLDGVDATRQRVSIKLRFFKGEWFLSPTFGVPYFRDVLIKNPRLDIVRRLIIQAAETEPNVDRVTELVLDYNSAGRSLTISNLTIVANDDEINFDAFEIVDL